MLAHTNFSFERETSFSAQHSTCDCTTTTIVAVLVAVLVAAAAANKMEIYIENSFTISCKCI